MEKAPPMPPTSRKRARQHPHAHVEASSQPPVGTSPAPPGPSSAPLPLLSLPQEVLSKHVWPHLGQWSRAQLRTTCRELRGIADRLLPESISVVVDVQQVAGASRRATRSSSATPASSSDTRMPPAAAATAAAGGVGGRARKAPSLTAPVGGGVAAAAGQASTAAASGTDARQQDAPGSAQDVVQILCRLLHAAPHISGVSLVLQPGAPQAGDLGPALAQSVVAVMQQVGKACDGRLTQFSLLLTEPASLQPDMLRAVGEAFPRLTQLQVRTDLLRGGGAAWASALRKLPPTLTTLLLDLKSTEGERLSSHLDAATQLTGLRSLSFGTMRPMGHMLDVSHLRPLIHDHLTSLSIFGYGTDVDSQEVLGLIEQCGPSLRNLDLNIPPDGAPEPQPAAYVAVASKLTSLRLSAGQWNIMGGPGDMAPIAALTSLRQLCLHQTYVTYLVTELEAGALSHLTLLELDDVREAADLALVVRSRVLAPTCKIVLEWFSKCALDHDEASVAAATEAVMHPGGIHTCLPGCSQPIRGLCPFWTLGWPALSHTWLEVGTHKLLAAMRGLWVDAEVEVLLAQCLEQVGKREMPQHGAPADEGMGVGDGGSVVAAAHRRGLWLWDSLASMEVLALEPGLFVSQEQDRHVLVTLCQLLAAGAFPALKEVYLIGVQQHDWLAALDLGPLLPQLVDHGKEVYEGGAPSSAHTREPQVPGARPGGVQVKIAASPEPVGLRGTLAVLRAQLHACGADPQCLLLAD